MGYQTITSPPQLRYQSTAITGLPLPISPEAGFYLFLLLGWDLIILFKNTTQGQSRIFVERRVHF